LPLLAQAYRLTDDPHYLQAMQQQLESWFEQCSYLSGPNWNSGLEAAIRLINWSVAWQMVGAQDSAMFTGEDGEAFRDRWLDSVYQHAHFIRSRYSRFSSANNHLIGEAAGVFISTCSWPFWASFREWGEKAFDILVHEAYTQVSDDGVGREQAIGYQAFILEFLVLSLLAGRAAGVEFPETYKGRLQSMLHFLA